MRAPRAACLLVLALLLSASACSPREEREQAARDDAQEALARGSRADALAALARLREVQPDTPEAITEYATLLVAAGEAPEAVWVLEDAVRRFDDHEVRLALVTTLLKVSDPARARDVAEQIPADAPQRARAMMLRGQAELALGNLDAALAAFEAAERDFPDQKGVRFPRIAALLQDRRFDEAREALAAGRESSRDEDDIALLRYLETALYREQARGDDADAAGAAVAGMRRLVAEAPEDPALWNALVPLYFAQRKHVEARELVAEALAEDPERLFLYPLLASIDVARGDREAAEASLRAWIERQPSPTAWATLARFHAEGGAVEEALAALDEGEAAFDADAQLAQMRAEILLNAGRLDDAEEAIAALDALASDPRPVGLLRGRLELARGDAKAARARLERLVPELDDAASQFWLGRALEESGDLVGAERRYGIAAQRSATDSTALLGAFRLASARGDWAAASGYAQVALQRAPGLPEAWKATLISLVELEQGEQAVRLAAAAIARFPDRADLHALHAAALRSDGRVEEALEAIERGRALDPDDVTLATERSLALAVGGDLTQGLAEIEAALARDPEVAELHHLHAMLLYEARRSDEGDRAVERALELAPNDLRPLRRSLSYHASIGSYEAARRAAERYLEVYPSDGHVHFVLGVAHQASGRPEAAIAAYRRAAELDASAAAPLNNLAEVLGREGRLDEALAAAQQAYRRASDDPHVLDTLGSLYLRSGRVDRAISLLEQAAPALPAARLHLALAYREAGRGEEARALLVALRPDAPAPLRAEVEEALATLQ